MNTIWNSGRPVILLAAVVICSSATVSLAVDYFVGDYFGWSERNTDYATWALSRTFYVGDALVFYYREGYHTVVQVNETEYLHCRMIPYLGMLASGYDIVMLDSPGTKYFICGVDDHCSYYNQRLKIDVLVRENNTADQPPHLMSPAAPSPPSPPSLCNR